MTPTRSRPRSALVSLTMLTACAVAGCGQPAEKHPPAPAAAQPAASTAAPTAEATAPATSAAVDACALVSQQEAQQLAGTALNPPTPVRETCTYTGPVSGPTAQVEVFVGDGAKKYLDIERTLGHQLRPLAGVGDESYAEDEAVFIRKSGTWVSVRLVRLNDAAENRKPLEDVARIVAGRL